MAATLDDGREFTADELLVAVGRRPATTISGSKPSGSSPGATSRSTTDSAPTGVEGEWLYAVGDCNGRALLTHMGKYQARIASDVILGKDATARRNGIVPRVTFTDPRSARSG